MLTFCEYESPSGLLYLGSSGDNLCLCDWRFPAGHAAPGESPVILRAKAQLDEYFARRRKTFDLPLAPIGTDFQQTVWRQLCAIPYGHTASYGNIARAIGRPAAVRAVAAAIGANRLSIVVPCHRVIGSDGSLTGYRGGLAAKSLLLDLESDRFFVSLPQTWKQKM